MTEPTQPSAPEEKAKKPAEPNVVEFTPNTPEEEDERTGFSNGANDNSHKAAAPQAPTAKEPAAEQPPAVEAPKSAPAMAAAAAQEQPATDDKADKPGAAAGKAPPRQDAEDNEPSILKSKFVDKEWVHHTLCEAWDKQDIDPEAESLIKRLTRNARTGALNFETENGSFKWETLKNGAEFIGRSGLQRLHLPQGLADDEAKMAAARGWTSVTLHGSTGSKEKLWLAAMRAGMKVSNFTPSEESSVYKQWQEEKDHVLTGLTNAQPAQGATAPEKPKAEEPATAEAKDKKPEPAATAPVASEPAATPPVSKFAAPAATTAVAPETPRVDEAKPKTPKEEITDELTKRAAKVKDPAHREGILKIRDAIESGKIEIKDSVDKDALKSVGTPKGFNKAAEFFNAKTEADLGLPKVAETKAPAASRPAAAKRAATP